MSEQTVHLRCETCGAEQRRTVPAWGEWRVRHACTPVPWWSVLPAGAAPSTGVL